VARKNPPRTNPAATINLVAWLLSQSAFSHALGFRSKRSPLPRRWPLAVQGPDCSRLLLCADCPSAFLLTGVIVPLLFLSPSDKTAIVVLTAFIPLCLASLHIWSSSCGKDDLAGDEM
jgi:hypothetical protein